MAVGSRRMGARNAEHSHRRHRARQGGGVRRAWCVPHGEIHDPPLSHLPSLSHTHTHVPNRRPFPTTGSTSPLPGNAFPATKIKPLTFPNVANQCDRCCIASAYKYAVRGARVSPCPPRPAPPHLAPPPSQNKGKGPCRASPLRSEPHPLAWYREVIS